MMISIDAAFSQTGEEAQPRPAETVSPCALPMSPAVLVIIILIIIIICSSSSSSSSSSGSSSGSSSSGGGGSGGGGICPSHRDLKQIRVQIHA